MIWMFVAYNGTVWTSKTQQFLSDAISAFCKDTGLTEWDIRSVTNQS